MTTRLAVGMHVLIPWGLDADREAVIVEIWGPADRPNHVRVVLLGDEGEEDGSPLLLAPHVLKPLAPA